MIRICEAVDSVPARVLEEVIQARLAEFSAEELVYEEPALRGIPKPTVAPAYLQQLVDDLGRLWVRDFTFPGEPQRWKVIRPDGRWLTDVEIPADLDVLEIGSDYILGRHTTELNVHVVHVYPLTWS